MSSYFSLSILFNFLPPPPLLNFLFSFHLLFLSFSAPRCRSRRKVLKSLPRAREPLFNVREKVDLAATTSDVKLVRTLIFFLKSTFHVLFFLATMSTGHKRENIAHWNGLGLEETFKLSALEFLSLFWSSCRVFDIKFVSARLNENYVIFLNNIAEQSNLLRVSPSRKSSFSCFFLQFVWKMNRMNLRLLKHTKYVNWQPSPNWNTWLRFEFKPTKYLSRWLF